MKLEEMTKDELLEAIDALHECAAIDPETMYSERERIVTGEYGDKVWNLCQKYRQPLIDFVYRNLHVT